MQHCKPIDTHIAKGEGLSWRMYLKTPLEKKYVRKVPYTRPDICFVISMVSWYQPNPSSIPWKVIKWILMYLKGIAKYSLCYEGYDL